MLIVPQDFDEKSPKKYPLIFNVYGGPGSDSGSVQQNYFYHQFGAYLVSNKSVIYATLDTRGSPNHGCKFMFDIYRKLGTVEVEDTIAVARYVWNDLYSSIRIQIFDNFIYKTKNIYIIYSVIRYFRDKVSYIDPKSISLWGWSYGGYLTTMALENDYNDTVFQCGIAVAPVSDWMYYGVLY